MCMHICASSLKSRHAIGLQHVRIRQRSHAVLRYLVMSSLPPAVCSVSAHRVDLSEHRALCEEQRLPGVHQDQIKVGLPGPVGGTSLWWIQTYTHKSHTCTYEHKTGLLPSPAYSAHFKV